MSFRVRGSKDLVVGRQEFYISAFSKRNLFLSEETFIPYEDISTWSRSTVAVKLFVLFNFHFVSKRER